MSLIDEQKIAVGDTPESSDVATSYTPNTVHQNKIIGMIRFGIGQFLKAFDAVADGITNPRAGRREVKH